MTWPWELVKKLNKILCEASGEPYAVRDEGFGGYWDAYDWGRNIKLGSAQLAEKHPFVSANKRTAACIAIALTLEGV